MVEFVTMLAASTNHNGNIRGVVVKTSDLKAGSGSNGDWTMKRFTIQDSTGEVEITCWNTDTGRFQEGQYYEVQNLTWKPRKDKPEIWQCGIGKDTIITKLDNPPTQTKIPTEEVPAHEQAHPEASKLPTLPEQFLNFIENETIALLQIEKEVKSVMAHYGTILENVSGNKIGMFVKEIYRQSKLVKFEKAQ